jgi:hypothetical protein
MSIDHKYNYDDCFFRDLTVAVLANLQDKIKWVNRFTDGDVQVSVPFYYSLTGSEDMLMDTFSDDIVSTNRFVELNTDAYPRAHITMESSTVKADEFANPNVWLRTVVENNVEIRNILSKVRAIPIQANYSVTILLNSEIDTFKAKQSIYNLLWLYQYIYFEFNFMSIDAMLVTPDDFSVEINRDKDLSNDNTIKMTFDIEVHTYYPAINIEHAIEPVPVYWGVNINAMNTVHNENPLKAGDWSGSGSTASGPEPWSPTQT